MERKEQVTQWVQNKIDKVLDEDLKLKIIDENSAFDVEAYVEYLLDKYFNESEVKSLKKSLNASSYYDVFYFESENSSEEQNSQQNSFILESNEFQTFPVAEIIKNLENNSEDIKIKFLRTLELSAEDLINQKSLNRIIDVLQKNLNKTENDELLCLVLKVFQKFLKCPKNPQIICKVFTSIAEVMANQIDLFNIKVNASEKIYDIKEEKWVYENTSGIKPKHFINPEILIKLMKLLLDCQQQIRIKGVRCNETKYREIIVSFIHLLSSTTASSEDRKLTGLEIVSVLDPQATWCKYWCHTAVGRTMLCTALRKYKNFFTHIIELMLKHIKTLKTNRLPSVTKTTNSENTQNLGVKPFKRTLNIKETAEKGKSPRNTKLLNERHNRSILKDNLANNKGENKTKRELEWIVKGIPNKIVDEAVFYHSLCLVSCLIQYRSGRALFPVQTTTKKRLLNVQDLSLSVIDYLENFEFTNDMGYTYAYRGKVLEILNDLKRLTTRVNSSRVSTER